MRIASIALGATLIASLVIAAACSAEHFPLPLASDSDSGLTDAGPGEASLPALESAPPAFIAPAARVSVASSPLVFDPVRGGVWTANGDVGSVSYADVDRYALVGEIPVGTDIRSVALSPDGNWLAAVDRGAASVALIDANARAVIRIIPTGTHPRAAVWDAADPRWLYVAVEDDDAIEVIDRTLGVLSSTLAVGRLPSGVAVSSQRRELYVTHRIDGEVTIVPLTVDLDAGIGPSLPPDDAGPDDGGDGGEGSAAPPPQGVLSAPYDVPLAYEVGDGTLTTPRGTPFGLESIAWATDGNVAWVPHELLAPTHPFQFQEVLFPTVSVVDLSQRIEVQTNPNDPNGIIAGRKNLFDAIDVLDPTGNTEILSQPCAAAFHPNGYIAYVVACASEDLLTFDLTQGIAVDLLRGLPGDHPVGITLDPAGARAFILADESEDPAPPAAPLHSKSLHVLDLAGGDLLAHVSVLGPPITLVAADPIDPDTRAGRRYFFRANSSKGEYATSGNFWLSCGGCHLDGFVTTNEAFFEDLEARRFDPGRAHRAHRARRLLLHHPGRERRERPRVQSPRFPQRARGARGARAGSIRRRAHGADRPLQSDERRDDDGRADRQSLQRDPPARPHLVDPRHDEARPFLRRRVVRAVPPGRVRRLAEERARSRGARPDGALRRHRRGEEQRGPVPALVRRLPRPRERGARRHVADVGARDHLS